MGTEGGEVMKRFLRWLMFWRKKQDTGPRATLTVEQVSKSVDAYFIPVLRELDSRPSPLYSMMDFKD